MSEEFENTRAFWSGEIVKGRLIWPDEFVIRFVKRNYRDKKSCTILDFGCGAGRNAFALAKEGYRVIAMDYTDEAKRIIDERKGTLPIEVVKNHGLEVPIESQQVDAVVADGSLFYNNVDDTIKLLENIKKTLKAGGKIWANWRSQNDSLCGEGELLDNGLYKLGKTSKREGCCYLFCNIDMLKHIYAEAGLIIDTIDRHCYTEDNGKTICEWYHVVAVNR